MKIKDMFYKEIDRDIKGVIKVGQADDENVYQELDEYVVTSELESYMMKFFQAYINGLENRTDKMGVENTKNITDNLKCTRRNDCALSRRNRKVVSECNQRLSADGFIVYCT